LLDDEPLIGAASVNVVLRAWRAQLNGGPSDNGEARAQPARTDELQPTAR
jgi:hypothetical protein